MELSDRIVRIVSVEGLGLLASDIAGRISMLDSDLTVLRTSPSTFAVTQRTGSLRLRTALSRAIVMANS